MYCLNKGQLGCCKGMSYTKGFQEKVTANKKESRPDKKSEFFDTWQRFHFLSLLSSQTVANEKRSVLAKTSVCLLLRFATVCRYICNYGDILGSCGASDETSPAQRQRHGPEKEKYTIRFSGF